MTGKQKRVLVRIALSAVCLIIAVVVQKLNFYEIIASIFYLTAYLIIGYDIIAKAVWGLRHRRFIDENLLMAVASVGAVVLREFSEGVAVMLFYQIGELFQSYAVGKSRKSIASLMDIRPEEAVVIRDDQAVKVSPYEVKVGEIIEIKPGEKIPLDGIVISGSASLNTSAVTGESLPEFAKIGSNVAAGCICTDSFLRVKVTKPFSQSSVAKVLELVEDSSFNKSKNEKYITKFARVYTPIVIIAALLLAIVPQFFITVNRFEWVRRALVFLVISCPCALVISVPLSFFGGIGAASSKGILIKGSTFLETLEKCDTVVFDKTGTLTTGEFSVIEAKGKKIDQRVLLAVCAAVESYSNHPLAKAVTKASKDDYKRFKVYDIKEISGKGITAFVEKWQVVLGNAALMEDMGISVEQDKTESTYIHLAIDQKYAGYIKVSDQIKEQAKETINSLKELEIENTVMLTGDREEAAKKVAQELAIDNVYAKLLPEEKVEILEKLIKQGKGKIAFVGDGINDAPALKRADISFAMGALGSDAAIEAADIVLMDDDLGKIPYAFRIAKKTLNIVKENIAFTIAVKLLFLLLGSFGATGIAGAMFADVGVTIIAVLNAMRTMKIK